MRTKLGALVAGFGFVCLAVPVAAHHSFTVEYDVNRPLKMRGVVTKVEWTSPHVYVYVDEVHESGARTSWTFEMASPNVLERNGWTRRTLSAGDVVSLEGYGGLAVVTRGILNFVITADGRVLSPGAGAGRQGSPAAW
jgi:hypothetical protein